MTRDADIRQNFIGIALSIRQRTTDPSMLKVAEDIERWAEAELDITCAAAALDMLRRELPEFEASVAGVTRSDPAQRLADLVDDDEALTRAADFLESFRARPVGSGGRMVWHLDRAGKVRAVEISAGIYQAS